MKKLFTFFSTLLILSTFLTVSAQEHPADCTGACCVPTLAKTSWALGFGIAYPRYFSSHLRPLEENYGAFASIEKNFTEHSALRLKGYWQRLLGRQGGTGTEVSTDLFSLDLGYLYRFSPCEIVSPYMLLGIGAAYTNPSWGSPAPPPPPNINGDANFMLKWIAGAGVNWQLSPNWGLSTEFAFNTISSQVEGIINNSREGIFGSNTTSFISVDVGALYYFSKGAPSQYCQLYSGINANVPEFDYERIENIVKKHIPREVVKEVVVKVPVVTKDNWVLVGCTFGFNKATLKKEAQPILWHATQVLLSNPDLKVEVQGYTDGIGSDNYNVKLSEKRAQAVKNYLVARGIASDRLVVKGYGKANPVASNQTADGRALNRRIEFKVID